MIKALLLFVFCMMTYYCKSQDAKDVKEVIQSLERRVVRAILDNDSAILKKLWAPEFMVNTPRNDIAKSRTAVLFNQRQGLINYSLFERVIEEMQINGNIVITMGYENFVSRTDIPGAKAGEKMLRRFTNVWKEKNGNWIQIARHASIVCTR